MNNDVNVNIHSAATLVDIEFADGQRLPTLTRDRALMLLEALNGALPHMAVNIDASRTPHSALRTPRSS